MKSQTMLTKKGYGRIVRTFVKLFVTLALGLYMFFAMSRIGLFLWEVSSIIAIYLISPIVVGYAIVTKVRQKKLIVKKRNILSIVTLLILISFYVWALIPPIMAPSYANQFDKVFSDKLGENYENKIPSDIRNMLSKEPFSWIKMVRREVPNEYTVTYNIHYGNHTRQYFDIYYPLNVSGYRPAIIEIHGGATVKSIPITSRTITEVLTARYFTAQGFVVISVEYRIPPEAHFIEMVTDIRTAIKWIRDHAEEYHINKSQIFVLGRSRGGQLATTAVYSGMNNNTWYMQSAGNFTSKDLEVMGVISIYGEVNPYMAEEWGNDYVAGLNKIVFGVSRDEAPDLYRNGSAEYLIGDNTPPTFLMHGSLDQAAFPIESRHLAQKLTEIGILNVYLELPTGKHGFDAFPWSPGGQLLHYYLERFIWYVIYTT